MIIQIILAILSCSGYYFIGRNPKWSYVSFIMLNGVLLIDTFNIALVLNSIFSGYFLIQWIIKTQK
jgi:hypothetical protein